MKTQGPSKPTPNFTWDEVEALRVEAGLSLDPVPESAFSASEYAKRYGIPRTTAQGQLNRFVAAGKLQKGRRTAANSSGRFFYETCYWK